MADTSLRDALSGLNVPAAENYWGIGATTLGEIAPKLINPYGKVGTNLGIGLGSVLLTALLGYQARQTAAEESITTNKLANELMALNSPEARLARIEAAKPELAPRLTSRLLEFNTALQGQEKMNALDVARQKALEEAKLEVEMSPLGQQLFDRQMRKMREQQDLITGRQLGLEDVRNKNKTARDAARAQSRQNEIIAKSELEQLTKANKLPPTAATQVGSTIRFGNDVSDLVDRLEGLSWKDYQYAMINPNAFGGLGAAAQALKNTYVNEITGKGITARDLEMTNIATASSTLAGMDTVISAWENLKRSAAEKGKSIIASNTQDPLSLFKGLDALSKPGGSFSFDTAVSNLTQNEKDLELALAPQGTEPAPNTVPPTPTPPPDIDAERDAAIAIVNSSSIPAQQKEDKINRINARAEELKKTAAQGL